MPGAACSSGNVNCTNTRRVRRRTALLTRHGDSSEGPITVAIETPRGLPAEIGDDHARFVDAKALKPYAGAAPVTRASGRSRVVVARTVKNRRLAATGYMWAFAALRSAEPRARYDCRREIDERHTAALRNLFNKLLGLPLPLPTRRHALRPRSCLRAWSGAGRMTAHQLDQHSRRG